MAGELLSLAESDLAVTLEDDWAQEISATGPDGVTRTYYGQVVSDRMTVNPDTGEVVVVVNPVITLRRSSLTVIPADGEKWFFRTAIDPGSTTKYNFVFEDSDAVRGGRTLGIIRIPVKFVGQA